MLVNRIKSRKKGERTGSVKCEDNLVTEKFQSTYYQSLVRNSERSDHSLRKLGDSL